MIDQYSEINYILPMAGMLIIGVFLLTGSVVAYRIKKTFPTTLMLVCSSLMILSFVALIVVQYMLFSALNGAITHTSSVRFPDYEKYIGYANIITYVMLFLLAAFSFVFVSFCSSITNIRKRNQQLEFMVEEFAKKNSPL